MVGRERQTDDGSDTRFALFVDDHLALDRPHRQNGGLRRGDDGAERLHTEHAHVGQGESAAVKVALRQLALVRPLRQLRRPAADLPQGK